MLKKMILILFIFNPLLSQALDKITDIKNPQDAMSLYQEIQNQGNIIDLDNVIKKHSSENLTKLLKDITLQKVSGYPKEDKLFRVIQLAEGSVYETEGIKVGDLVRMKH